MRCAQLSPILPADDILALYPIVELAPILQSPSIRLISRPWTIITGKMPPPNHSSKYLDTLEPQQRQDYLDKLGDFGLQRDLFSTTSGDDGLHSIQSQNTYFCPVLSPLFTLMHLNNIIYFGGNNIVQFRTCHCMFTFNNFLLVARLE